MYLSKIVEDKNLCLFIEIKGMDVYGIVIKSKLVISSYKSTS